MQRRSAHADEQIPAPDLPLLDEGKGSGCDRDNECSIERPIVITESGLLTISPWASSSTGRHFSSHIIIGLFLCVRIASKQCQRDNANEYGRVHTQSVTRKRPFP